ncbi:hypothetical protein AJ79_05299 [Helicocarpus griseus UAMH5409]|uniref:Dipeptidylpeptidase IV N-terminal domain-containing protein n=1 Tax=Helicocarpus griseus UAMH5409 TaxID=1447875 RepID=A0A2B7XQ30_9EURO|nr:hypothetical protein AJ79_05299 [Helicocarpus griseus UAMH5409]
MSHPRPVLTLTKDQIAAHTFPNKPPPGPLDAPDIVFPVLERPESAAISPDGKLAAYATRTTLRCINQAGKVLWQYQFTDKTKGYMNYVAEAQFSLDGKVVWFYRPDCGLFGDSLTDQLLALNADTGSIISQVDLGSTGHGAQFHAHSNNKVLLLDVGEGQDGSPLFAFYLDDDNSIVLSRCDWCQDRLIDTFPDGNSVWLWMRQMRVLCFTPSPMGGILGKISLGEFGEEDALNFHPWPGGYLDGNFAMVNVYGECEQPGK